MLTIEEMRGPPVEIWPDNLLAVNVFIGMSTQWRVGNAGAIGLDYNALPAVMRFTGVQPAERSEVFDSIRVLEEAALNTMRTE